MKKFSLYLFVMMLASVLLVGCGSSDADTATPNPPPKNDSKMPKNQTEGLKPTAD